jgi:hypothetical protein
MLKQQEEMKSNTDGSMEIETRYSSGPMQECGGCPLLYIGRDSNGPLARCAKYKERSDCQMKKIILIERV